MRDSSTRDSTRGGGHRDRIEEEVSGEAIQLLCANDDTIGVTRPVLEGDPSGAGEATASARGQGSQPQGQPQCSPQQRTVMTPTGSPHQPIKIALIERSVEC